MTNIIKTDQKNVIAEIDKIIIDNMFSRQNPKKLFKLVIKDMTKKDKSKLKLSKLSADKLDNLMSKLNWIWFQNNWQCFIGKTV
jgi:hypothetical protein